MALSDCAKCWETPCVCGHDYRDWSEKRLEEQIAMLQGVLGKKAKKAKPPKGIELNSEAENPNLNPYIVLSQRVGDNKMPVFDRHTLQEAWPTEEHALHCAGVRRKQGYWVTCYTELAYGVPD